MTPAAFEVATMAWLAAVTVLIAPMAGLVLLVLRNARDVQAAWALLHKHEEKLNGGGTGGSSAIRPPEPGKAP